MSQILEQLAQVKIVPVVAIEDAAQSADLCRALTAGGLPCAEITFRTAAAEQAIAAAAKIDGMLVGAGTVLTVDQVKRAVDAGATFMVSPGYDSAVVDYCLENGIAITPGIATPSELQWAVKAGLEAVKFFPAEAIGGVKLLKALSAPFGGMRFVPTGGISADNLADYLSLDAVLACGGSWMVKKDLIAGGQFDKITELTRQAVTLANSIRA